MGRRKTRPDSTNAPTPERLAHARQVQTWRSTDQVGAEVYRVQEDAERPSVPRNPAGDFLRRVYLFQRRPDVALAARYGHVRSGGDLPDVVEYARRLTARVMRKQPRYWPDLRAAYIDDTPRIRNRMHLAFACRWLGMFWQQEARSHEWELWDELVAMIGEAGEPERQARRIEASTAMCWLAWAFSEDGGPSGSVADVVMDLGLDHRACMAQFSHWCRDGLIQVERRPGLPSWYRLAPDVVVAPAADVDMAA